MAKGRRLNNLPSSGHVWYAVDQDNMTEKVNDNTSSRDGLSCLVCSTITPGGSGRSSCPSTPRAGLSSASGRGIPPTTPSLRLSARRGSADPLTFIFPRSFSDRCLQLGSARHLILPPHQDLQCQQDETRHRRPSGRDRGQGRQLQPAHHAARVEPRERGRLPQEHAEAPSRAPQLDRPVEHAADFCMIHVVAVIIVIL